MRTLANENHSHSAARSSSPSTLVVTHRIPDRLSEVNGGPFYEERFDWPNGPALSSDKAERESPSSIQREPAIPVTQGRPPSKASVWRPSLDSFEKPRFSFEIRKCQESFLRIANDLGWLRACDHCADVLKNKMQSSSGRSTSRRKRLPTLRLKISWPPP